MKKSPVLWIILALGLLFILCGGITTVVFYRFGAPMVKNVVALQNDIKKTLPNGGSVNIGFNRNKNGTAVEIRVAPVGLVDEQATADAIAALARESELTAGATSLVVVIEKQTNAGVVTVRNGKKYAYPMTGAGAASTNDGADLDDTEPETNSGEMSPPSSSQTTQAEEK